jgi:hypothetical protein
MNYNIKTSLNHSPHWIMACLAEATSAVSADIMGGKVFNSSIPLAAELFSH